MTALDTAIDVGALFVSAIQTAGGYLSPIIVAGLVIWGVLFAVGIGKKAAKKASA